MRFPPSCGWSESPPSLSVTFAIANLGTENLSIGPLWFKLELANGSRYLADLLSTPPYPPYWNADSQQPSPLAPGGSAIVSIVFNVPADAVPSALEFSNLGLAEVRALLPPA